MSSLTSSLTPQLPHNRIHLKTQWAKRLPKWHKLPHKLPNPQITTYPNPTQNTASKKSPKMRQASLQAPQRPVTTYPNLPQNTMVKKAPKMWRAPLQASQPLNYDIPQPTSKHSGQEGSQNEMSYLTSSPTPQLPITQTHLKSQWAKKLLKWDEPPYMLPNPQLPNIPTYTKRQWAKRIPKWHKLSHKLPNPQLPHTVEPGFNEIAFNIYLNLKK